MHKIKLQQLSNTSINSFTDSFERLPETSHRDGKYRLRRYSRIRLCPKDSFRYEKLETKPFNQSEQYNDFQGGVDRLFENLEDDVIESLGMLEMCDDFLESGGFPEDHEIEIHQMRIVTKKNPTPVSPEGVHQDGYSHIAIVGGGRHNISGGHVLVHKEKDGEAIINFALEQGEMIIINDRELWHNATDIKAVDRSLNGYMDAFILTAR
jgi:hypothetical protein